MKLTPLFIILVLGLVVIFDFYIVFDAGAPESISAYIIRWSHEYPSISFLSGYLCGHLFWRMSDKRVGK